MRSIDIETIPNKNLICCLPEPEPAGNLKDPEKIAADIAKKRQSAIDKMALSPLTGRICSVASWSDVDQPFCMTINSISDASEIELIKIVLNVLVLKSDDYPQVCTWNGYRFDLPFIAKRAMILNVELPIGFPGFRYFLKKYSIVPHADLAMEMCNWGSDYISLNTASRCVLGDSKIEIDVTKFHDMIEAGDWGKINSYNLKDAELTFKLWIKMKKYIF